MESNALGLDDLVGAMPHAAAVLDRAGLVVTSNPAWASMQPMLAQVIPSLGGRRVDGTLAPDDSFLQAPDAVVDPGASDPVLAYIDHRPEPADTLRDVIAGRAQCATERFVISSVESATIDLTTLAAGSGDSPLRSRPELRVVEVQVRAIGAATQYVLATCQDAVSTNGAGEELTDRHPVTGLVGRRLFLELLGQAMTMSDRHRFRPAALAVGVEGMDSVEAVCGIGSRDELVVAIASRLQSGLRPGDVVAQLGDETFVVMLPDIDGAYLAEAVSARLTNEVAKPFTLRNEQIDIGLAIGVAIADRAKAPAAVLEAAELALLEAADSPARIVLADGFGYLESGPETLPAPRVTDRDIDVKELRDEELITYFQPVLDLTDQRVVAGEALMRWRHPHYGVLSAGEFLGLAVNAGMLPTLTDQALVTATETWADIRADLGAVPPRLFVNLSPDQLLSRVAVERLHHLLIATGIPANDVVVEVTEEAMSTRFDEMLAVLVEIRQQGLRVALDDFGSGYSSLGRLRHLPVDVLKVDQSLVRGLEHDRRARQVLAAVSTIAAELDVECIVEGIETPGEAAIVGDLGFRFVQGYHFFRPMPAAEFASVASPQPIGG